MYTVCRANAGRIPNYGERQRASEVISTAFTESAVNQVISKRMVKETADALDAPGRSPATSAAGTPDSAGHWSWSRSPRSLPCFVPLSMI